MTTAPAFAQDTGAPPVSSSDDVIYVSGTRIQREDLQAVSPVQTISDQELTFRNSVNVDSFLQELPQVQPSNTNISNNPGSGTASVDLRGLGTNRTLVLMNGTRLPNAGIVSGNSSANVVDLNMIPTALIQRVDVVTGGASAVYGSDAIAGVVNFILKDDFQGVQLDSSYQFDEATKDGGLFNVSLLLGGNFADGRGNAVLNLGFTDRQAIFAEDNKFSAVPSNPLNPVGKANSFSRDIAKFGTIPVGSTSIPGLKVDALVDFAAVGLANPANCPNGTTSAGGGTQCLGQMDFIDGTPSIFIANGPGNEQYNFAAPNFAQIPQQRWQIGGFGTYEITDHIEGYARGIFSFNEVLQQLAPTPFSGGAFPIVINFDNPFLPAGTLALLNTVDVDLQQGNADGVADPGELDLDGDGVRDVRTSIGRRQLENGNRFRSTRRTTFQQMIGLRGDIPGVEWKWDVNYAFGRSDVAIQENGNIDTGNFQEAVQVVLDGNGVPVCKSGNAACVPINIWGENTVSPAGAVYVGVDVQRQQVVQQHLLSASLAGDAPFTVPFATAPGAWVIGVEYREESANQKSDTPSATSNIRGFNGSPNVGGRFTVTEFFGEVTVPLIQEQAFFEDFSINGAVRFSDYSSVGSVTSYTGGASWEPGVIPGLRLRGQYQKAVRAPNISELFAPQSNNFPATQDPCATGPNGRFDGDPATRAICEAAGVPAQFVGSPLIAGNSQTEAIAGGNPNLQEETAETITFGAVYQPSFLDGLTLQVDYYDISIDEIIATLGGGSVQNVLDACYFTVRDLNSPFCQATSRLPNGAIDRTFVFNENISMATTRGIDINATYRMDLENLTGMNAGALQLSMNGSYLLEKSFIADNVTPLVDCAGFFGTACFNNNDPQPHWSHIANATWYYGPATFNVRWRFIGGTDNIGTGLSGVSAVNYVDIAGSYAVMDNLTLSAGILNVGDREPPYVGLNLADNINTFESTYDILGRQFFFGASLRF